MTITFVNDNSTPNTEYDTILDARTGSTFLVRDSDGEEWVFVKTNEDKYITLGSSEDNYCPGMTYDWDELKDALEDYKSVVRDVNLTLKVDNDE
jgi:hypothetical protein